MRILLDIMDPRGALIVVTPTSTDPLIAQTVTDQEQPRPPMWELAECTCPDYCERDHERD